MKTKRQHRSTLDLCRKYLRKSLIAVGDESYADKIMGDDDHLEKVCESVSVWMDGNLTVENWRKACDIYFCFA